MPWSWPFPLRPFAPHATVDVLGRGVDGIICLIKTRPILWLRYAHVDCRPAEASQRLSEAAAPSARWRTYVHLTATRKVLRGLSLSGVLRRKRVRSHWLVAISDPPPGDQPPDSSLPTCSFSHPQALTQVKPRLGACAFGVPPKWQPAQHTSMRARAKTPPARAVSSDKICSSSSWREFDVKDTVTVLMLALIHPTTEQLWISKTQRGSGGIDLVRWLPPLAHRICFESMSDPWLSLEFSIKYRNRRARIGRKG
jgi:hypothetical protein